MVAAIAFEMQRLIATEDAPLGRKVALELLRDPATPAKIRADLAVRFMALAGHVVPTTRQEAERKQLQELSAEELRKLVDEGEGELAARARDVSAPHGAPTDGALPPNTLDYLD